VITLVVYADLPRLTSVDDCILSDDMPPDMTRILPYAMFSVRPETSSDQNPSCTQREEVETDLFFASLTHVERPRGSPIASLCSSVTSRIISKSLPDRPTGRNRSIYVVPGGFLHFMSPQEHGALRDSEARRIYLEDRHDWPRRSDAAASHLE
jgi:hypothetical protein